MSCRKPVLICLGIYVALVSFGLVIANGPRDNRKEKKDSHLVAKEGKTRFRNVETGCVNCHAEIEGHFHVAEWQSSRHALVGVGCNDCHGDPHNNPLDRKRVSSRTCAECHPQEAHATALGRHSLALTTVQEHPELNDQTSALIESTCVRCHRIGEFVQDDFLEIKGDTSLLANCSSCHFEHSFSVERIRSETVCKTCHEGHDAPQWEVYAASPHARIIDGNRVASCIDCHDAHDDSCGIARGSGGLGRVIAGEHFAIAGRSISRSQFAKRRHEMLDKCVKCHTTERAERSLMLADDIKREADDSINQMLELVVKAQQEGWLKIGGKLTMLNGNEEVLAEFAELTIDDSKVEQLVFAAVKHYYPLIWKAAYHQSPSKTLEGKRALDRSIVELKIELQRLEQENRKQDNEN